MTQFVIYNEFFSILQGDKGMATAIPLPYAIDVPDFNVTITLYFAKEIQGPLFWAHINSSKLMSPVSPVHKSNMQCVPQHCSNHRKHECVWVTGVSQPIQCQSQSHCVCSSVDMAYFAWQLTSHTSQGLHNNTPCRGDSLIGFLKESLACICILIDECFFFFVSPSSLTLPILPNSH